MTQEPDNWEPCPAGELGQMVHSLQAGRRKSTMTKVMYAVAVLFVGISVTFAIQSVDGKGPGGIDCGTACSAMQDYKQGTLDSELTTKVAAHLRKCDVCRQKYEATYGPLAGVRDDLRRELAWLD